MLTLDVYKRQAAHTAKEQEKEGWIFTLDYPSYSPFMTYSTPVSYTHLPSVS